MCMIGCRWSVKQRNQKFRIILVSTIVLLFFQFDAKTINHRLSLVANSRFITIVESFIRCKFVQPNVLIQRKHHCNMNAHRMSRRSMFYTATSSRNEAIMWDDAESQKVSCTTLFFHGAFSSESFDSNNKSGPRQKSVYFPSLE